MGPLRSGPRGRTDGVGQYKTSGMRDSIRAQRGRARSTLSYRVLNISAAKILLLINLWQFHTKNCDRQTQVF